jgi:hypothetical protein
MSSSSLPMVAMDYPIASPRLMERVFPRSETRQRPRRGGGLRVRLDVLLLRTLGATQLLLRTNTLTIVVPGDVLYRLGLQQAIHRRTQAVPLRNYQTKSSVLPCRFAAVQYPGVAGNDNAIGVHGPSKAEYGDGGSNADQARTEHQFHLRPARGALLHKML